MQIETLPVPADLGGNSLYAEHRDESGFFNPWGRFPHSMWALVKFWLRPKLGAPMNRVSPRRTLPDVGSGSGAAITWVGHCSFVIQDGRNVVLTDPRISIIRVWRLRAAIEAGLSDIAEKPA
jgi:hypothetical protein